MRVLLIATNRHNRLLSRMDARPVPIGLAYVAAYIDQEKHQVEILTPVCIKFGRTWN